MVTIVRHNHLSEFDKWVINLQPLIVTCQECNREFDLWLEKDDYDWENGHDCEGT